MPDEESSRAYEYVYCLTFIARRRAAAAEAAEQQRSPARERERKRRPTQPMRRFEAQASDYNAHNCRRSSRRRQVSAEHSIAQ